MRVLSALTTTTISSELLHELVHYCIVQTLQWIALILVCHSRHSVLKEVYLQLSIGVHIIVHVEFLHGGGGFFFGCVGDSGLG